MICHFSPGAARRELTPVDNLFLSEYLPDADGDAVKVYLYGLMQCYHSAVDKPVNEALCLSHAQVICAFSYWQNKGLVRIVSEDPLSVEYLMSEQPASTTEPTAKYARFVQSLSALLAPRSLRLREMQCVYDCMETFGLDERTVLELISYCMEQKGKNVSMNYVVSVAESWRNEGVVTPEQARARIDDYRIKKHGASEVLRRWNKHRQPTCDEMALYDRWISEWGFDREAILAVCPQLTDVMTPTFEILGDRLYTLYQAHRTRATDIEEDRQAFSDDREFCRQVFARMGKIEPPTKTHTAQIGMFLHDKGLPREVILLAADECANAERPLGKLKTILSAWADKNVRTADEARRQLTAFSSKPGARRNGKAHSYAENPLRDEDVNHLIVDLNEDI